MNLKILFPLLLLTLIFTACGSRNNHQVLLNEKQVEVPYDSRIDGYIDQLGDRDAQIRESAMKSLINETNASQPAPKPLSLKGLAMKPLIDEANESESSRRKVIGRLIYRFDSFMTGKKFIEFDEKDQVSAYLKLFLDLNALEALDVMVKNLGKREPISPPIFSMVSKTLSKFGEEAIPSLKKGLRNPDISVRNEAAITLCDLKFKRNDESGIIQAIEAIEEAKKDEENEEVARHFKQAIETLEQRKIQMKH